MPRHPYNIRSGKLAPLGPALNEYFAEGGQLERAKSSLAAELWPQIVGPWYARHSCVIALRKKELQVYCDSPQLAQQLQMDQEIIVARLNERLGGEYVRSIRAASVGPLPQRQQIRAYQEIDGEGPEEEELARVPLPAEQWEALQKQAAQIPNEKLREGFLKCVARYLRLEEWKRLHGYRQCPACGMRHKDLQELCYACRLMRQQPYLEREETS